MKKATVTLALVAILFPGCSSSKTLCPAKNSSQATLESLRADVSWSAFCASRGYDLNNSSDSVTNEYLDTWCGSVEEEKAFIKSGIEPY